MAGVGSLYGESASLLDGLCEFVVEYPVCNVRGHVYPVEAGVRLGQAVGGCLHAVDGEQAGARRPRGALEGAETL